VPAIETSPQRLFASAVANWSRHNFGSTAAWKIPGESDQKVYLMIHGFRGDHHGLAAIAAGLKSFEVIIPDLPGYGKSKALTKSDLDEYANWLIALTEQIQRPVVLIGHSFGTLVCSRAIDLGLRVERLCLIAPISSRSIDQKDLGNSVARVFYNLTKRLGGVGSFLMRSSLVVQIMSIAMATTSDRKLRSWIHNQHQSHFSNYESDEVVETGFWSAAKSSVRDFSSKISMPTLLIAGDKDLIAPLEGQLLLDAELENSRLEIVSGIGHLLHYEAPARVAELIENFTISD
jgi:pimeloyl-ACP methyl ester carboxylesterase